MNARIRVAVIGGGQNCEHEVSLSSAASVASTLLTGPYEVVPLTITRDGTWLDEGRPVGLAAAVARLQTCHVVLPIVHGPRGEDGTLAALCELAGVKYVGSGVRAGAIAMDKWTTKLIANAMGIATATAVVLTRTSAAGYAWTHPVVVKPVAAGSSRGVALVRSADELAGALEEAFAYDDRVLVEDLLVGREIDIAVLGGRVSPPLEIANGGVFDYETKYGGGARFVVPAPLEDGDRKALEDAAQTMYAALDCRGVARVDFFRTDAGWVLNEVNTMPGFTEHSQVPRLFAAAGLTYAELLDLLIADALAVP